MQITLFGATGKVGRLVITEAAARGHTVIAFQRRPTPRSDSPLERVYQGDIYDASKVAEALHGSDAVISALGSWGTPGKDILSTGMRHIIPAMEKQHIPRIVSLTGADAQAPGDDKAGLHQLTHALIRLINPKVLGDGEEHIRLLSGSRLDWTVVRSPVMTPGSTNGYALKTTRPLPSQTISRRAVAKALVDQLEERGHVRSCPYVTRA